MWEKRKKKRKNTKKCNKSDFFNPNNWIHLKNYVSVNINHSGFFKCQFFLGSNTYT